MIITSLKTLPQRNSAMPCGQKTLSFGKTLDEAKQETIKRIELAKQTKNYFGEAKNEWLLMRIIDQQAKALPRGEQKEAVLDVCHYLDKAKAEALYKGFREIGI